MIIEREGIKYFIIDSVSELGELLIANTLWRYQLNEKSNSFPEGAD